MHGWYSEKAVKKNGNATYIYKAMSGEEVECTVVTESKTNPNSFGDEVYLGEMAKYLRPGIINTVFRSSKND